MARLVDDPARGRSEKAILPSGHESSLSNMGVGTIAVMVFGTAASVDSGIVDDTIAVDIAAMLDRKFLLFGFIGDLSVDSSSPCFSKIVVLFRIE